MACLLPQEIRDEMRAQKAPASAVLSSFDWDHVILHCFGGEDFWWNLDPKIRAIHREKSKLDTKIAAKAKRIDKKWSDSAPRTKKKQWPKQKIQSRGFGR